MEKVLNGKIINEKKVWSANKLYKLFGILMYIGCILLVGATIYMFFTMTKNEAIGGLFIMPIPILLAFVVGKSLLRAYRERREFTLYWTPMEIGVPIDDIMRDYYIVEINQAYVVFTEKKNRKAYSDWNLFYKPESLYMEEQV